MLEHVTPELGSKYLDCILSKTNITKEEILDFCKLNDTIGNPSKKEYDLLKVPVSPSSLRYIYHAHLILTHMKTLGTLNTDILELGGGYGGLCLAVQMFAPKYGICINSYRICDLANIIRLQKLYLDRVNPALRVEYVDAASYGKDIACESLFLISNYCFSEISSENQILYRQNLFPKVVHGFIAWNHIPLYNFGFITRVEPEVPLTGPDNKYVYF